MSAKVMGLVFEADLPRAEKFILLALADHAKEDGSDVYPSVARIEWKTGYSERQIRTLIDNLEKMGILRVVHPGGSGPADVRKYKIVLASIPMLPEFSSWKESKGAKTAPLDQSPRVQSLQHKGAISDEKGCNFEQKKGAAIAPEPRTITVLEPPVEATAQKTAPSAEENYDIDASQSGQALADLLGVSGPAKFASFDAVRTVKRRRPEMRWCDIPFFVQSLWREYDALAIRGKVSQKSFLNEIGRFVESDNWRVKPKENGHAVDEHGGHYEGTVYVTKEGRRLPGYKPLPRKPEGLQ